MSCETAGIAGSVRSHASAGQGETRQERRPGRIRALPPERRIYAAGVGSYARLPDKCGVRALGSERAPEGESPSLAGLPARQLKVTASRKRDVESNWK